jgi:POT family proton-dependent oligopeptide transporter
MALHGTPNDLLQNLDPIALIVFIPLLDRMSPETPLPIPTLILSTVVIYPGLRKMKIDFDPISRIFVGFMLVSVSMVYASVLQHYIYNSEPKSIHVWIQAPAYIFVAFSEAFIIITGLELAFTQAPKK